MKKKGFTLIEIIVVITIIATISVGSFLGIKLVNKNIKVTKLENIENKIFEAVSIYIENNKEAKTKLYNSKNGVYVPLNVLKDEGLIDFQDIKITDKDYVITMLGSYDKTDACLDTTTVGSWNDGNKTIYLCTTSDGNTNIQTVGGQADNISRVERERYYFTSINTYGQTRPNYVEFKGDRYRILYVDSDDSLVLLSDNNFGNVFSGLTQPIETISYDGIGRYTQTYRWKENCDVIGGSVVEGATLVTCCDAYHAQYQKGTTLPFEHWFSGKKLRYYGGTTIEGFDCIDGDAPQYKIRLKPCVKIISGTGRTDTPYKLDDSTCS